MNNTMIEIIAYTVILYALIALFMTSVLALEESIMRRRLSFHKNTPYKFAVFIGIGWFPLTILLIYRDLKSG